MIGDALLQGGLYLAALLLLARPLGFYMYRVYMGRPTLAHRLLGPLERLIYRLAGIDPKAEMGWKAYAGALLACNAFGFIGLYALLRLQGLLPLNPEGHPGMSPALAFNTAVSFTSNTNWQAYGGETTLGHLAQMLGLTAQNFLSAATGMAVLMALTRGFARKSAATVGNFWADLVRGTVHILLPLSAVTALILVSQGVVQTLRGHVEAHLVQPARDAAGRPIDTQRIALGPAASQVAIKQLGTNGGGFFNTNSTHPLENPTPLSGFVQMLAILLIPAALCHTFGRMIGDPRQGRALLWAMTVAFALAAAGCFLAERAGNPVLAGLGADIQGGDDRPGGNMEGKELRFGVINSAIWATATTAASNGSVDAMHDSFMPLGGLVPLVLILLGEVIFGGVGSGLYGMLIFALMAVFLSGLMVGRTPEYLGKKIGAFEVKMAAVALLAPTMVVLLGTALSVSTGAGRAGLFNPGPHGLSEALYAFASAGNNNGSAFAGLRADSTFHNVALGLAMLIGRYIVIVPTLALAGSLAARPHVPPGAGTFPTHTALFVALLLALVVLVGALTFLPALSLGPIVEQLLVRP